MYTLFAIVVITSLDAFHFYMSNKLSRSYEVYGLIMTCIVLCVWSVLLIDDEWRKRNEREEREQERENGRINTAENNPYHVEEGVI